MASRLRSRTAPGAPPRSPWVASWSASVFSGMPCGKNSRTCCGRRSRTSRAASSAGCARRQRCWSEAKMRAVLCKAFGGPESLVIEAVASPPLRPGTARVAVHAAGVNFGDTLMIAGTYQEKPPFPFTPGFEIGGEVIEVAPDVATLRLGDRVMGTLSHGGYADEAVVAAEGMTPIPPPPEFPLPRR